MNYVRTAILLAALTALLMGIGYLLGGRGGAVIAFFVAAAALGFVFHPLVVGRPVFGTPAFGT